MKSKIYSVSKSASLVLGMMLVFQLLSSYAFSANENLPTTSKGYLVTLNGQKLTGSVSAIVDENQIIFINDFGTIYTIHAALVYGFVIQDDERKVVFQSKYHSKEKLWRFLKVIYKSNEISLFEAPEYFQPLFGITNTPVDQNINRRRNFYIEMKGRAPALIKSGNFKKVMREIIGKRAPRLAAKIGKKGYRFQDLPNILEEYNKEYKASARRL
ncbi:MAG: hypothetical protein AAFO07_19710 [Bacteroidota bacterium]